jgi:hypothetical protein
MLAQVWLEPIVLNFLHEEQNFINFIMNCEIYLEKIIVYPSKLIRSFNSNTKVSIFVIHLLKFQIFVI